MSQCRSPAARRYGATLCMRLRWASFMLGGAAMALAALAGQTAHAADADTTASTSTKHVASSPAPADCGSSATQLAMNGCAHDDFLAASGDYAKQYAALSAHLGKPQADRLRKLQSAWLRYRTEACRFEAGPSTGGSVHDFVYWSCAARMTRVRTAELLAQTQCREGDLACTARRP